MIHRMIAMRHFIIYQMGHVINFSYLLNDFVKSDEKVMQTVSLTSLSMLHV